MVSFDGRLRACQLLDVDDADLFVHQHCAAEVQYLPFDIAHQERKDIAPLSLRDDGRPSSDKH